MAIIPEVTLLIITIIGAAIKANKPEWIGKMEKLAWQLPLGLLLSVFLISLIVSSYNLYNQKTQEIDDLTQKLSDARKLSYPPISTLMMSPYFKNLDIPLGEFGLVNARLVDRTFENCRIHGPIVVFAQNTTATSCSFSGNEETTFIVTTNRSVGGVLAVIRCNFINCEFINVSFIGDQKNIDGMRGSLNSKSK